MFEVKVYNSMTSHRTWGVYRGDELICVCVYKKGAENVCRILNGGE